MSSARTRRTPRRAKSPDAAAAGESGTPGLRKLVQKRILTDVFEAASGE